MATVANLNDMRTAARGRLPRMFFDYLDGGSFSESTLRRNEDALDRVRIRQRVMKDVSDVSTATTVFGRDYALPLGLGPVGFAGLFHASGETAAAAAARSAGVPFCLSTFSVHALPDVANRSGAPWMQVYLFKDQTAGERLLELARASHVDTLVLTVDSAISGIRERDTRNGFRVASRLSLPQIFDIARRPRWLMERAVAGTPQLGTLAALNLAGTPRGVMAQAARFSSTLDSAITPEKIAKLRQSWSGKLIIKGILDPDDARRAIDVGADGIVVSNHGGRQLDGSIASIEALPRVAKAVNHQVPVLFDSGIRRGTDILRAVALGADAVLLGRAWAYGFAAKGVAGIAEVLGLLSAELRVSMALAGFASIAEIREAGLEAIENTREFL